MNYLYKQMTIVMLLLPALLLCQSIHASGLEVVRSSDGTLKFVPHEQKDPVQSAQKTEAAKTRVPVNKTHDFIKQYGLTLACLAPLYIPKEYFGPVNGALVGAALGAVINDNDRLKGAAFGTAVGAAVGTGTAVHHFYFKRIVLRTAHGAILNTESANTIACGALCGATQAAAEVTIQKAFLSPTWKDKGLGTIPATLCGAAVLAGIGMPALKSVQFPLKEDLFFDARYLSSKHNLALQLNKSNAEYYPWMAECTSKVLACRAIQCLVTARIREKFAERESALAETAQEKK